MKRRILVAAVLTLLMLLAGGLAYAQTSTTGTIRTPTYLLQNEFQGGQATGSITSQSMRDLIVSTAPSAVCTNIPGSCAPQTIVAVPCGATLSAYISTSSPSGTIYQLGGTPAAPCTYANQPALAPASNITIQGDCSSPVGANTIIDGANASHVWINGQSASLTGVKIKCLTVQHFYPHTANCSNFAALFAWDGWEISHSSISNNGCIGLWISGAALVSHNYFGYNLIEGVEWNPDKTGRTGADASGTLIGNEFDTNGNSTGTDTNAVIAAVKIVSDNGCSGTHIPALAGARILFNYIHDTKGNSTGTGGNGIWTDCETSNTQIIGNTIVRNGLAGAYIEISVGVDISHNYFADNDYGDTGNSNGILGCIYVNTSAAINIHDNYCAAAKTYGGGIGLEVSCRPDAPLASSIGGNIRNVWIHHNTISFPNTGGGVTAGYSQDDSTSSGSTSYGALCSSNTHPADAKWNKFNDNVYYATSATGQYFSANSCGIYGNFTLAQIQSATGSACLTAPNYPNELGSTIIAAPTAMATPAGCFLSALAGRFCDELGNPW